MVQDKNKDEGILVFREDECELWIIKSFLMKKKLGVKMKFFKPKLIPLIIFQAPPNTNNQEKKKWND